MMSLLMDAQPVLKNSYGKSFLLNPLLSIIVHNVPAMPLNDAHFGGFFVSGAR
jgi:hypothetical protein